MKSVEKVLVLAVLLGCLYGGTAFGRDESSKRTFAGEVLEETTLSSAAVVQSDPINVRDCTDVTIQVSMSNVDSGEEVEMIVYGQIVPGGDWGRMGIADTRTWDDTTQPTESKVYPVIFPVPMEALRFDFYINTSNCSLSADAAAK